MICQVVVDADSLEVNFVSGVDTTAQQHRWHCVVKRVADFCFLDMFQSQLEFWNLSLVFFPGGSKPNLADLAVFGVLRPIRNLQTGQDMIASTSIGGWYSRMEDAVGPTSRLEEPLMSPIDHSMKVWIVSSNLLIDFWAGVTYHIVQPGTHSRQACQFSGACPSFCQSFWSIVLTR